MQPFNLIFGLLAVAIILVSVSSYSNCASKYKNDNAEFHRAIYAVCFINGIVCASTFGDGVLRSLAVFAFCAVATWAVALLAGVKIATSLYYRKA